MTLSNDNTAVSTEKDQPILKQDSFDNFHKIMSVAALFKGIFSIDWIIELTELSASKILSAFEKAINEKILIRTRAGEFCFKDQQQKVPFQNTFDSKEKNLKNQKIADIILRTPVNDDEKIYSIANHLLHLDYDLSHCQLLLEIGDIYRKTHRYEDSYKCYLKIIIDLKDKKGSDEIFLFFKAVINASKIAEATSTSRELIPILENAIVKAEKNNMKRQVVLLELNLAKNEWFLSKFSSALKHFERGFSISENISDDFLRHSTATFNIFFLYFQGRFEEVVQCYEIIMQDVEKYPSSQFFKLVSVMIGVSYIEIGQVTQGFGLVDAIHEYCKEKNDNLILCHTGFFFGGRLLWMGKVDEALKYLDEALEKARLVSDYIAEFSIVTHLALAYYKKGQIKKSCSYLKKYTDMIKKENFFVATSNTLLELAWAMEQNKLSKVENISLKQEIEKSIQSKNISNKSYGYYFQGLLFKKQGHPVDNIIQTFKSSLKWIEKAGSKVEKAQILLELSKVYLAEGATDKAKKAKQEIEKVINIVGTEFVPNHLRLLYQDMFVNQDFFKEIMLLSQELSMIRDNKELVHHIISKANHIIGAERGAIFIFDKDTPSMMPKLRAARNLVSEDITHPNFIESIEMIKKAAATGESQVFENQDHNEKMFQSGTITSCICVPMKYKDKMVGVLYHDNRLFPNKFKKDHLEILQYFAAQASIAMDNLTAYEEIKNLAQKLKEEKQYFEEQNLDSIHHEEIVGKSDSILRVFKEVDNVAGTDANVLIQGETGVGKELIARALHRGSKRKDGPFIRVNCSAFPDTLIASELFGHEKGAFTGATEKKMGRFELADKGTLFLDEIGDISMEVQIRLLRVLQSKEYERVGGVKTHYSDFRLITATNRDLRKLITEGKFRNDLFFRLNVFPITVPPIRERREDIPLLAQYFLQIYGGKFGKSVKKIKQSDMKTLMAYGWPGNVRELEHVIERGVIISSGSRFKMPDLKKAELEHTSRGTLITLAELERRHIIRALKAVQGKIFGPGGAAEILDIHPHTLYSRMKKLNINKKGVNQVKDPDQ